MPMSDVGQIPGPDWLARWPQLFVESLETYAVFAIDLSGIIRSWQPGVENVFEYNREAFVGQPAGIIFTEVDRQGGAPEREMDVALRMGQAADERWHVRASGDRFWGSGIMLALRNEVGEAIGFAKLVRDRTEERLEDEVKDLNTLRLEGDIVVQDEQIRELATDLTLAEQRERQRISQLLHDELQQQLFALQMHLHSLRAALPEDFSAGLEEAYALTKAGITMTRTLVSELNPLTLQEDDFSKSLVWLAKHMRERHGLEVTLHGVEATPNFPPALSVLLFQCLQELLFNVVKHAGVEKARLEVKTVRSGCAFTVKDAGKGFSLRAFDLGTQRQEGFGLRSVQRRLEPFGGAVDITVKPGEGTQVTIFLPLD